MKKEIVQDIKGALGMIGQAQERCLPQSDLWKELGLQYDQLDSIIESVEDGDYDHDSV